MNADQAITAGLFDEVLDQYAEALTELVRESQLSHRRHLLPELQERVDEKRETLCNAFLLALCGRTPEQLREVEPGHWETTDGLDMAREYATRSREDLTMSDRSDLGLANAIYLIDRNSLDLGLLQTAAKERIRWLSTQLALRKV